jgi:hypothetical protein
MKQIAILLVAILCLPSADARYDESSTITSLSSLDMSTLVGGCGSGTCTGYTPSCPSGCTKMGAKECQGSSGSCVNSCFSITCDCPGRFVINLGCM